MGEKNPVKKFVMHPVSNLIAGTYDFYLYGHGNQDNQNGVFQFKSGSGRYGTQSTTTGSTWLSSVWQEGSQYVEFSNVSVAKGAEVGDNEKYCEH